MGQTVRWPIETAEVERAVYVDAPLPICLLDKEWHVVGMNRRAEEFWAGSPQELSGAPAASVLGIEPLASASRHGAWQVVTEAVASRRRVRCRITGRDGHVHLAMLFGIPLEAVGEGCSMLVVVEDHPGAEMAPEWVMADGATGLGNRYRWEIELRERSIESGAVLFLDLDDLKQTNDLYGHAAGDRALALVGRTVRELVPPGALAVRYGGDEFVLVLPGAACAYAERLAADLNVRLAQDAPAEGLPFVPHLHHGVAELSGGELSAAALAADRALYENKGIILPSEQGGALVLTRGARERLRTSGAGGDEDRVPGSLAERFDAGFDRCFRSQFARTVQDALEFVRFARVEPGTAVVEVGAGSGRITIDGGLARRVGSGGQLLVTDPSRVLLDVARRRAAQSGLRGVRFLVAPAERVPLASGCADLALGALFLHLCDPVAALREMGRIVRPGGRVAVSAGLAFAWPPVWEEILRPVWEEMDCRGLRRRPYFDLRPGELAAVCAALGLDVIEDEATATEQRLNIHDPAEAVEFMRQASWVAVLLRPLPPATCAEVEQAVVQRALDLLSRAKPAECSLATSFERLLARRPE